MNKNEINPTETDLRAISIQHGNEIIEEIFLVERFKEMGKENDPIFQTLVFLGKASAQLSYARTVLSDYTVLPDEYQNELSAIQQQVHNLKEKLRGLNYCPNCTGVAKDGKALCAACER